MKLIDKFLNQITMYRLALYYALLLWAAAFILIFFKFLPYAPFDLLVSAIFIQVVCLAVNFIFARVFRVPSNIESVYTTGFILALIISPAQPFSRLLFFSCAAALAMASKYIIVINKKHLFNPAALAVALTAIFLGQSADWWVGNLYMLPFVLLGGLLMIRKLHRWDLVASFFVVAVATIAGSFAFKEANLFLILKEVLFYSPIVFFACVMLIEPATTPPTKNLRMLYGAVVGFLFVPAFHIGPIFFTPELALLVGNIFAYIVSPKHKLVLELKEKIPVAVDVYEFSFKPEKKLKFKPGQYMEWTLGHHDQDARGIRRYFTIASSPTEDNIKMGIKFYHNASSFKKSMLLLKPGDKIVASQLAGDFVLPANKSKKLVFIAGGIGVTPFRSMIKYLVDKKERRDIILFYSNKTPADIAYKDIFDRAERELGIKIIYTVTDTPYPTGWQGERGFIDEPMIERLVPDYKDRIFYLSGPNVMVAAFEELLQKIGVRKNQIKKDFFPGFA